MIRPPSGMPPGGRVPPAGRTADLLALSVPLLILLAVLSTLYRSPSTRLQALPALCIGGGLLLFSWLRRRRRRTKLLRLLREPGSARSALAPPAPGSETHPLKP